MGLFPDGAEIEIVVTSGVLRVSLRPRPTLASLLVTAGLIVAFVAISLLSWPQSAIPVRVGEVLVVFGAVFTWFQQLSGSEEEIEIGEGGHSDRYRNIRLAQNFGISDRAVQ